MDRIGGSGVFARDPDTILVLTKHEDDAFVVETTLRNHPQIAPYFVRWQYPLMQRDDALNPAKLKSFGGKSKTYRAEDLLRLLPGAGLTTSQWLRQAVAETGMGESTFHRGLRELKRAGKIIESVYNHGNWVAALTANTVTTVN